MVKIKTNKRIWLIAIIFFLFVLFVINPSLPVPYKTFISDLLYLPLSATSFLLNEIKAIITYRITLNENLRLKREMADLKAELLKSQGARQENERLRKLLSLKTESNFSGVFAWVIGQDVSNWSNSLIIDKGSKNKIKVGLPVISSDGLVGKIQEVGSNTSKVVLISDPNLSVAAVVQRSRQEAVVSGTLSDKLIMRYLNKDADIQIGDSVLTSGMSSIYPKGIPIGKISYIGREFGGLSIFALVKPAVRLLSLEEVMVILE